MLHFYWVDIPSKANVVYFLVFQLTVFSTFQHFDLHLEFSTFNSLVTVTRPEFEPSFQSRCSNHYPTDKVYKII